MVRRSCSRYRGLHQGEERLGDVPALVEKLDQAAKDKTPVTLFGRLWVVQEWQVRRLKMVGPFATVELALVKEQEVEEA
jgi:hypothetical protein